MKKCAIYTRVSTDNQAEKEFNSCETQELKIKSFINSQEDLSVYKVYSDPGFSGGNINRPAMQALLRDIKDNKIDLVISYKIDRLTRSPKDFYHLIEVFDRYEVDFISVTERFDTSTPSGRLLRNIMLMFADYERSLASERTKDKMFERAKAGLWHGGNVPYGYQSENKKLVVIKKEAENVRFIFDFYVNTGSLAKTCKILQRKNIRKKDGNLFFKSTLESILSRRIYVGEVKYKDKNFPGIHEPIISTDLFNEAQKIHKKKKRKMRLYKDYIFGGLLKCSDCESSMTPTFTNKITDSRTQRYYYYRCTSTFKKDWHACNTKQVNAVKLENYIIGSLKQISSDPNYIDNLVFRLNNDANLGYRKRLEISESCSKYSSGIVNNILKNLLQELAKGKGTAKNLTAKKYLEEIKYSPQEIQLIIKYRQFIDDTTALKGVENLRAGDPRFSAGDGGM